MRAFVVRYPKNRITDILLSLICLFAVMLIVNAARADTPVGAQTDEYAAIVERFISENGLTADLSSLAVSEKLIPYVFDATYADYAILQREQGFELDAYRGRYAYVYSYELENYEFYENDGAVFVNIMVCDGRIIAADICTASVNGFITGVIENAHNSS